MKLRDIMTTDVSCASPSDSLAKLAADMKRHNVGVMPICENGNLVGVLTDRDIVVECVAAGTNPRDCKAGNFMTSDLVYGTADMDIVEAARLMGREQVHRLPVLESGKFVGMVSIGDLAFHCRDDRVVADMLREISTPVRSAKLQPAAA